jgi:DNA-binding response OmpR family regulator
MEPYGVTPRGDRRQNERSSLQDRRARKGDPGDGSGPPSGAIRAGDVGRLDRVIRTGELAIDVKNFLVLVGGEPLELRLKEFLLLVALASRPGRTLSRKELAVVLWGDGDARAARTVDVNVRRLRTALARKSSHCYVHTMRRSGYRLVPPGHEDAAAKAHPRAPGPEDAAGRDSPRSGLPGV